MRVSGRAETACSILRDARNRGPAILKKKNSVAIALSSLTLAVTLGAFAPAAHSSCVAPQISIAGGGPYHVGDSVTVRGRYWTGECNDTIVCSSGCFGRQSCSGGGPPTPAQSISLALRGHGRSIPLADNLSGLAFAVDTQIPRIAPGEYRIVGNSPDTGPWHSEPVEIEG
jgi:hypothetical protein